MSHCPIWGFGFSNLCNGAKVLSLLPKDSLKVCPGRKQGFLILKSVEMWLQPNRVDGGAGEILPLNHQCWVDSGEWAPETLPKSRLD